MHFGQETWRNGEKIQVDDGIIVYWHTGNGVEMWEQTTPEHRVMGLDPHFVGPARMQVRLTHRVQQSGDDVLEGCFYGWASPQSGELDRGQYPLVFRAPEFGFYRTLELPAIRDVQIAAFAGRLDAYRDDEAFDATQPTAGARFASEMFIPTGLFRTESDTQDPFRPYARFNGHVLQTATLTNPATGFWYHWAHIRTVGGEIDVVCEPNALHGPLIVGGVVSGLFWLSGRVIRPDGDGIS